MSGLSFIIGGIAFLFIVVTIAGYMLGVGLFAADLATETRRRRIVASIALFIVLGIEMVYANGYPILGALGIIVLGIVIVIGATTGRNADIEEPLDQETE